MTSLFVLVYMQIIDTEFFITIPWINLRVMLSPTGSKISTPFSMRFLRLAALVWFVRASYCRAHCFCEYHSLGRSVSPNIRNIRLTDILYKQFELTYCAQKWLISWNLWGRKSKLIITLVLPSGTQNHNITMAFWINRLLLYMFILLVFTTFKTLVKTLKTGLMF